MTEKKTEEISTGHEEQILQGTRKANKTYLFNEEHDPALPAEYWFQNTEEGLTLFIIFYTQACRWSRCIGCNLPSKMSLQHISFKSIMDQIDNLFKINEINKSHKEIKKVIISNNGSVLDEATFSSTALMYLLAKLNINFTNLEILAIETRPEFVDMEELEFLQRAMNEGNTRTKIELCIGFEVFDNDLRNIIFDKGLTLDTFESLIKKVSKYNYHIKCYFMQKPVPIMNDEEAVKDIQDAIDYLSDISKRYKVKINIHLNPTFVAEGTSIERSFIEGKYSPPKLIDIAKTVLHAKGKNISIFIGLSDEGLAVEGGSFLRRGDEDILEKLKQFNKTNDYLILEDLLS